MFYILNRTRKTKREWTSKTWPEDISQLGDFINPDDTLELVERTRETLSYHGLDYIRETVYTYGMERVSKDGTSYVDSRQRAIDWLNEARSPTGVIIPKPRCGQCLGVSEEIPEVQSIRDSGLCPACRVPKLHVVVPKKRKK